MLEASGELCRLATTVTVADCSTRSSVELLLERRDSAFVHHRSNLPEGWVWDNVNHLPSGGSLGAVPWYLATYGEFQWLSLGLGDPWSVTLICCGSR